MTLSLINLRHCADFSHARQIIIWATDKAHDILTLYLILVEIELLKKKNYNINFYFLKI